VFAGSPEGDRRDQKRAGAERARGERPAWDRAGGREMQAQMCFERGESRGRPPRARRRSALALCQPAQTRQHFPPPPTRSLSSSLSRTAHTDTAPAPRSQQDVRPVRQAQHIRNRASPFVRSSQLGRPPTELSRPTAPSLLGTADLSSSARLGSPTSQLTDTDLCSPPRPLLLVGLDFCPCVLRPLRPSWSRSRACLPRTHIRVSPPRISFASTRTPSVSSHAPLLFALLLPAGRQPGLRGHVTICRPVRLLPLRGELGKG
jgi:hypothetical protein